MVAMIVGTELDDDSIRKVSNDIQRRFDRMGQNLGGDFMAEFADGAAANAPKVQKAVDKAADATGRLRTEQEKLDALASRGASRDRIVAQSERVAKARRDEARAYKEASKAAEDYGDSGDQAGGSFLARLRGASAGASAAGGGFADSFAGGFAGARSLGGMGGGLLRAGGWVAAGAAAGKLFGDGVADGMQTIAVQDFFQARMGLDESSMSGYADAAGRAYANNFGASLADNLATAQLAKQAGIIDESATSAQVQATVEQLQGLSAITESTAGELSRSITTLMRTGLAGSVAEASDIITAGFQDGLDVSGDWLDTINEYSTQARKFGLDASEYMTLLKQGLEGGARDTDKVADSLKEFAIRAVDGSKTTREGFEALGFSADDMARRFSEGGDSATIALDATFDALRSIDDPMQQALVWQRLFGTQFEDLGDAVNQLDLDPVKNEFRDIASVSAETTRTATDNWVSEWDSAMRTAETQWSGFKTWLADEFTDLPGVKQLPALVKWVLDPGVDLPSGPSGPMPLGYTPTSPLPQPRSAAQGPGLGPFPVTSSLDEYLNVFTAPPSPAADTPTEPDMQWDWRTGGLVPAGPGPSVDPALTPGERKPILTDAEAEAQKEAEKSGKPAIDPSRFSLDSVPIGSFGDMRVDQLPGIGPVAPMQGPPTRGPDGYGYFEVDPQKVFDAETSLISQRQSVENARQRLLELEDEGTATQADINAAKTAVLLAERGYQSQAQKLAEAQQGTWQKLEDTARSFASGMEDIGATLDADFGLSGGLPGLFENATKAIANLAAAPLLGPLSAIKDAAGDEGSGLLGIAASNGMFGPRFMPDNSGAGIPGYPTPSMLGPAALQPGMYVPMPGGRPRQYEAGMVPNNAQLLSLLEQMYPSLDMNADTGRQDRFGEHGAGEALDIMVGANAALGDQINKFLLDNAQVLGLQYNIWKQALWYPDGRVTPMEDRGSPTQNHMDHVHARVQPGPAAGGPVMSVAPPTVTPSYPTYQPAMPSVTPTAPTLPAGGSGWAGPGIPSTLSGGGGQSPVWGLPSGPGLGAAAGAPPFMNPPGTPGNPIGQSLIPGQSPGAVPGAGSGMTNGIGGIPLAGIQAAASGLDLLAPGAGAAANLGIQLANRTIGFAGQQIGNLASGFFETFSLSGSKGGMTDPLKTLPGRFLAGVAGARPSLPNTAGGGVQQPQPDPRQQSQSQQLAERGGALVEIKEVHQQPGQAPESVANEVASQFRAAEYASSAFRW